MMFGDHDKQVGFGKRISPSLDIAVGKWFTPGVGIRLMYNGLSLRGATRWGAAHSTGEQVPDWGEGMYYSKFKYYNVRADVMFNLSNLFADTRKNVSGTAVSMQVWVTCVPGKHRQPETSR